MNNYKILFIFFFFFVANSAMSDGVGKKQSELTGLKDGIWLSYDIPVCFENPRADNRQGRNWVREAVRETWELHSSIKFTGWGKCKSSNKGIRIKIADDGPHVKKLGSKLDGKKNGMVLNFTFEKWSTDCKKSLRYCTKAIAVHEFGHALGFAHEQNRSDAPNECRAENKQGTTGDIMITEYDMLSVMNYCNPLWNGNGQLSALDIEGVNKWYGASNNIYTESKNSAIKGHNKIKLERVTVSQCKVACDKFSWCRSFDYYKRDRACDLSSQSLFNVALKTNYPNNPYNHYEKNDRKTPRYGHVVNAAIKGHNEQNLKRVTVKECREFCDGYDWCKSFDYYKGKSACDLSKARTGGSIKLKYNYPNNPYDHYFKK
jgi:hypothetical protein